MRSNGYYRQPPSLQPTFQAVSRRLIAREKQKLKAYVAKSISRHGLALVCLALLNGCAQVSSPKFPDPTEKATEEITPCLLEGSELHDWVDRLYKLKDQLK